MFGIFRRRNRAFIAELAKAAAEGAGKAQIRRAMASVGVLLGSNESATEYAARAASEIAQQIARRAGVEKDAASDDDLFTGGLFVFVMAGHLSYVLEAEFEQAASLGLLLFLTDNGLDLRSAAAWNDPVIDAFNARSGPGGKYVLAVGQNFVEWTEAPTEQQMDTLTRLYDLGRKNWVASS